MERALADAAGRAPGAAPSGYALTWSGGRAPLGEGENILGRDPELALFFDSSKVSRHHARLRVAAGRATLEDLGSKNGTFVNGRRIDAPAELSDGDEIRLGALRLKLRRAGAVPSTDTEVAPDEPHPHEEAAGDAAGVQAADEHVQREHVGAVTGVDETTHALTDGNGERHRPGRGR
jgi:pSer/pThr/pTyr-binding forkhead associated (FHA) protein